MKCSINIFHNISVDDFVVSYVDIRLISSQYPHVR